MLNIYEKNKNFDIIKGFLNRNFMKLVDFIFYFKHPSKLKNTLVIFHGASCCGKSYTLRWLKRKYKGFLPIEMDRFANKRFLPDPDLLNKAVDDITNIILNHTLDLAKDPDLSSRYVEEVISKIKKSCLIDGKYHRHHSMIKLFKACLLNDSVIVTCGELPPPRLDNGYYESLEKYTNKKILHVLISPKEKDLIKRIHKRGREEQLERWLRSNKRRLSHNKYYDLIIEGNESSESIIKLIRESISFK